MEDAMGILMDASRHERSLRKRVRRSSTLEDALGELFETDGHESSVPAVGSEAIARAAVEEASAEEPFDSMALAIERHAASRAVAAVARTAFRDDIFDLLELAECDLPVVWPKGWDIQRASIAKLG